MKRQKGKITAALVILGVLAFTFWWGGNAPGLRGWGPALPSAAAGPAPAAGLPEERGTDVNVKPSVPVEPVSPDPAAQKPSAGAKPSPSRTAPGVADGRALSAGEKLQIAASLAGGRSSAGVEKGSAAYSERQGMVLNKSTGKDKYLTGPVPEGRPVPVEPQDAVTSDKVYTCTLSVCCDAIFQNIKWLDAEKAELAPEDGVIFPNAKVTFYEGESVFNVLWREMKKNKIHLEFENTPIYNSAYIEGINNLYEFDCGELSGWMYKVNGWFPNYGCSRYQLKDGDVVEWVYTCDLGIDVGGYYAAGGE